MLKRINKKRNRQAGFISDQIFMMLMVAVSIIGVLLVVKILLVFLSGGNIPVYLNSLWYAVTHVFDPDGFSRLLRVVLDFSMR